MVQSAINQDDIKTTIMDSNNSECKDALMPLRERALNAIQDGVIITDAQKEGHPIFYINDGAVSITGYQREDIVNKPFCTLLGPQTSTEKEQKIRSILNNKQNASGPVCVTMHRPGQSTTFVAAVTLSPIKNQKKITHFVWTIRDVTDQQQKKRALEYAATHDSLTGLPNKNYFTKQASKKINCYSKSVIIMADLDHFEVVNDKYGHPAGDHVLSEVGTCLKKYFNDEQIVCRYGGEEFSAILPDTTLKKGRQKAHNICNAIESYTFLQKPPNITISIGIAVAEKRLSSGIKHADQAMYKAKKSGRNAVCASKK